MQELYDSFSSTSCQDESITNGELYAVNWATMVSAISSLFGSSMMIVGWLLYSQGKGISSIVVFLAISDWGWAMTEITAFSIIIHKPESYGYNLCLLFRILFQFFSSATVFWRSMGDIASNKIAQRLIWYHVMSWGVPLMQCVFVLSLCGHLVQDPRQKICVPRWHCHLFVWFLPIVIAIILSIIIYALFLQNLHKMKPEIGSPLHRKLPFRITSDLFLQMQGLLDCFVYGLTNKKFREGFFGIQGFFLAAASPLLVIPLSVITAKRACSAYRPPIVSEEAEHQKLVNSDSNRFRRAALTNSS